MPGEKFSPSFKAVDTERVLYKQDLNNAGDPPSGTAFVGLDSNGDIAQKLPDGTIEPLPGGGSGGGLVTDTAWMAENVGEDLLTNASDPKVLPPSHFGDSNYRIILSDLSDGTKPVYTASDPLDFATWTEDEADLFSSFTVGNFQDVFVHDGTFYLLLNNDAETATDLYTASSLTSSSVTDEGQALASDVDGGLYIESDGTMHYYAEDADFASGKSSNKISHHTADTSTPTSTTEQSIAVDVTGRNWTTGDPEIHKYDGVYWMFLDVNWAHPNYRTGVAVSSDLNNWTITSEIINTGNQGGDLTLTPAANADYWVGLTEFTQSGNNGIGAWKVWPINELGHIQSPGNGVMVTAGGKGRRIARFDADSTRNVLQMFGTSDSQDAGFEFVDQQGRFQGEFKLDSNNLVFQPSSGNNVQIGIPATGSTEVLINPTESTRFDRGGSRTFDVYDGQFAGVEPQDLTAAGAPPRNQVGVIAVHDGTGTPPKGIYENDPANSQWSGVGLTSGNTISH